MEWEKFENKKMPDLNPTFIYSQKLMRKSRKYILKHRIISLNINKNERNQHFINIIKNLEL